MSRTYVVMTVLTCVTGFGKPKTVSYSLTVFFQMISAIAESATRLPPGAPGFDNPEAPELQAVTGVFFLVFLAGAGYQVWRLR